MRRDDTIAALATPPGRGAVAIVRLSGADARRVARALTGTEPRPRFADLCTFRAADGTPIDRGLLLFFPGPASYTGEDIVELHCHGGPIISDSLLRCVLALGVRAAEPGEFTLRAFLNDKLDLLQAEAVADLIGSGSEQAARAATRSLHGEFSNRVSLIQAELTRLRVEIEAWLDFPDDELELDAAAARHAVRIAELASNLRALARDARSGVALRDGLTVVIAGPPNVGKSSLLNRLAGYAAAIVTDIPGTTRDPLREHISIDGVPLHVIDTAGVRESADPIEREGVERARSESRRADRVLWLADAREPTDAALALARAEISASTPITLLRNKIDLTGETPTIEERGSVMLISLSALTGTGVELLHAHLREAAGFTPESGGTLSARRRHLAALGRAESHVAAARAALGGPLEILAEELRAAQTALSELTGELTSDDLLGEIFATFCIGK